MVISIQGNQIIARGDNIAKCIQGIQLIQKLTHVSQGQDYKNAENNTFNITFNENICGNFHLILSICA